jgi:hypothetical protein
MRRSAWITILGAAAVPMAVSSTAEAGQNDAILIGVIRDASTGEAVEGAVVVVTGEKLQGERTQTTNISGLYRIPNLPPGQNYTITVLHSAYGNGQRRSGMTLRAASTFRVDISLIPTGSGKEVINVEVPAPTVDVGSASLGLSVDREMARRVPIALPTGKGGANRSFEAVAEATPGARNDTYGTSVAGTTSPENKYYVDGLSVNDPAFGLNGTGLSVEFIEEVRVEAGGYLPEFGRATGGIVNAITKTGSNEFHGSVWGNYTPGQLQGRNQVAVREGTSIVTNRNLGWIGDAGFDVGGRIIKDKLWFYGGVSFARTVYNIDTHWNRRVFQRDEAGQYAYDEAGNAIPVIDPNTGFTQVERIAGTQERRKAQSNQIQALVKLTYTPVKNHTLELMGIYAPTLSGGNGTYAMNNQTALPEVANASGTYNALASQARDNSSDLQLKWTATADDNKWNFDTTVGWHHQVNTSLPVDGSRVGGSGLAAIPGVIYRRNNPVFHDLSDAVFGLNAPGGSTGCGYIGNPMDATVRGTPICPVQNFTTGGPGFIYERSLDRVQTRSVATRVLHGAGTHVLKFGVDFEYMSYNSNRGYSGGTLYREGTGGTNFADVRQYSFLTGPDQATILKNLEWHVYSTTIGGFVQDSWSIMDKVTLNAGLRYDAQHLFSGDKKIAMALPNQLSPRIGLIFDPTQSGHAKLFVNYARYYQSVPLNLADRAGSGEPSTASIHYAADAVPPGVPANTPACDPMNPNGSAACRADESRLVVGDSTTPDQLWILTGAGKVAVDPKIKAPSTDEVVAGGEVEIIRDARIGLTYSHRWMTKTIEDMSRDEATTYFIGNPGYGIARDFPKAQRVYDAVMLYFDKRFTRNFLMNASYTMAFNRGNIAGLFRPETGQLDPNTNSTFDLQSLLVNQYGALPGDTRHAVKLFTAGEIPLGGGHSLTLGGSFRAASGGPTNALASHLIYGANEAYLLPRGTGPRLPWQFRIDTNFGYRKQINKDLALTLTMTVFNVANFQQVAAVDESYTSDDVVPVAGASLSDLASLRNAEGGPITRNPNFGKAIAYQQPRMFSFGVRLIF